jgi:hypothetical protein
MNPVSKKNRWTQVLARWIVLLAVFMGGGRTAEAGWLDEAYDYWASGEMGEDMLNSVGVSADDIAYSIDHPDELLAAMGDEVTSGRAGERLLGYVGTTPEKVANTISEVTGDPCVKGPTIFDDLQEVYDGIASGRTGEELLQAVGYSGSTVAFLVDNPEVLGEALYDEWASGRTGERLIAYGDGLVQGAVETTTEAAYLVGDGLSYGYVLATTETDEELAAEFDPSSKIVSLYKNSDDPGATTVMILEGLANLPAQFVHDIQHDPEALGKTVGSFALPIAVPKGLGAVNKGVKGFIQSNRGLQRGAIASRSAVAADSVATIRVATQPKGIRIRGQVLDEYSAVKPGPLSKTRDPSIHPKDSLQGTFSGGRYTEIKLSEPRTVYRLHDNGTPGRVWNPTQRAFVETRGAGELGAFWSLERPLGSTATRIESAVLPEWGNSMTHMTAVKLPAGTVIQVGEVGAQGGMFVGGGSQLVVEGGAKAAWIVERLKVP